MKTFKYLTIMFLALLCMAGCKKESLDPVVYRITAPESDIYTVSCLEYAAAGETVEVTVTVSDKAAKVTSVLYNDSACKEVSAEGDKYVYSFEMPSRDVELKVNTSSERYGIRCIEDDYCIAYDVPEDAVAGSEVTFRLQLLEDTYTITSVSYGTAEDEVCELVGSDEIESPNDPSLTFTVYTFRFTMPARDVTLKPVSERPMFRVYRPGYKEFGEYKDAHVYVRVQNHYRVDYDDPTADEYGNVKDPDDPYWPDARIVESVKGDVVMFLVDFDLGYDSPAYHDNNPQEFITVTGIDSGVECPVSWTLDQRTGLEAWGFTMPEEDVLIEGHTTELTTYEGEEFVDTYDGYYIHWGNEFASTVQTASAADIDLELKASTLFLVNSTDTDRTPGYDYDNEGLYSYSESDSYIAFDHDSCADEQGRDKDGFGIQGQYAPEAWVVDVIDLEDGGLSENIRYFFTVKKSAGVKGFIAASNGSGSRFLIQVVTASGTEYWYYYAPAGARSLFKVTADFSGKDINEEGAVSVVRRADDDAIVCRYSYTDGAPVFENPGSEAGTYTGESGELVLDGLGNGTLDGKEGTYTVDVNIITFTSGDTAVSLVIDRSAKTYTITTGIAEWTGPLHYTLTTETGNGGPGTKVIMDLVLNSGEKGMAKIQVAFASPYSGDLGYGSEDIINDVRSYVYDSTSGTITISNVLQGKVSGWGQERRDIVLKVSEDKNSLAFTVDKLISTTNPNKYVTVTGLSMTATE